MVLQEQKCANELAGHSNKMIPDTVGYPVDYRVFLGRHLLRGRTTRL